MSDVLYRIYRPNRFEDVLGQDSVVKSLKQVIEKNRSQAFIFNGPSGTGKTTLARICAAKVGCLDKDIIEIDGASNTGIDDMRKVLETLRYRPFGDSDNRAIIIDEAHRISQNAWDSLLKSVEEPPEHIYWFFCTTNEKKIPATIKTRCASFVLKPVNEFNLRKLMDGVCNKEKIKLDPSVGDLIIKMSMGSPRQLLVNLAMCRDCKDKKEASQLLQTTLESDPSIEFCRFVVDGKGSWTKAMTILEKLSDESPEGIRILVCNYTSSCLKSAKTDKDACYFLSILEAFGTSYQSTDGMAPLFLSLGRVLYP